MSNSDILYLEANKTPIVLTHNCMNENGFEDSDIFTISDPMNFEQIKIKNQYNQEFTINPNQIKELY